MTAHPAGYAPLVERSKSDVTSIIFHSDRGSQYMSREFAQAIADRQMVQSVGRTGVCWDNWRFAFERGGVIRGM